MIMKLEEKGLENFKGFVKTLTDLLVNKKIQFDLLIGTGDSGIAMVRIAKLIYAKIGIKPPGTLLIPYFRFTKTNVLKGDRFEKNYVLIPQIQDELQGLSKSGNILFVDDEIGRARTIKGVLELLKEAKPELIVPKSSLYILAEDHGFNPTSLESTLEVNFVPFGKVTKGINNAISYIIPYEIEKQIIDVFPDEDYGSKARMNSLFGLPIKVLERGHPRWSYEFLEKLNNRFPDFKILQEDFENYILSLITKIMTTENNDQNEKDIQSVIRFLEKTDPENANREHAIEMLGNIQSLAHLIAHKVVDDERAGKLKEKISKKTN